MENYNEIFRNFDLNELKHRRLYPNLTDKDMNNIISHLIKLTKIIDFEDLICYINWKQIGDFLLNSYLLYSNAKYTNILEKVTFINDFISTSGIYKYNDIEEELREMDINTNDRRMIFAHQLAYFID